MKKVYFPTGFYKRIFAAFYLPILLFFIAFGLSAGFFWSWDLVEFLSFVAINAFGCFVVVALTSYFFTKQYSYLLYRTYQMSSKFRFWVNEVEDVELDQDDELFLEMDRALNRVRSKLLRSRRKLAHELEQAKALMRSLQDAVVTINLNQECLYFNSAFATAFLDVDRIEKFQHDRLIFSQAIRSPGLLNTIEQVIQSKKNQQIEIELLNRRAQMNHDFLVKISPLFEEKNKQTLYGVLILFHDITEYKSAERLRMQFVENASHELRTPLTSVKGYLDLAMHDVDPQSPIYPMLLPASEGVSRLVALVNDLLDLAKIDKKPDIELDWVNPVELSDRVFQVLSPLAQKKQIQLKLSSELSLVKLDDNKMEQVLINLVANAVQYNPSGTIVHVKWELDGENPILKVEDNGIGIPSQHWDRLFDRFYRIDGSRDRSKGGTGLGLAIVKQLVEAHGAKVEVRPPSFSQGTCFQISFKPSHLPK